MSDDFVKLPITPPPFPKTRQEYLDKFEKNSGFLMRLYEGWRWDREKLGWLQAWQERDAVKGTCTRIYGSRTRRWKSFAINNLFLAT